MNKPVAIIFGVGAGLSASLARLCAHEGMAVALAARNVDKLADLASETGGRVFACDVKAAEAVTGVFSLVEAEMGATELVVFNASARYRAPLTELAADHVCSALMTGAFGGFLVGQAAARAMLPRGHGSIFFTGATASVKGVSGSAPFAMQKFALRGLAQSMAREFQPQGLHITHFVIDGGIASTVSKPDDTGPPDRWLDPDAIARTYLDVHRQHRSAWTSEVELRPWVEKF
jgi:NAD(P)-dependent dehydrogenase (short-subunit alcohol dehydrogenase family)